MIANDDRQAPVTDYFQKDAPFWEDLYRGNDVFSMIHRERAARAMGEVGRLPLLWGSRVLEVGCGAGLMAVRLAGRGFLVEATDSTPAMIELTRGNAERSGVTSRLAARVLDVHAMEYPANMFDLVVALGVLPWLHSPELALREMTRVLRPGGYLLANIDNRARLTHLLDPLFNPLLQPIRRRAGHGRAGGPTVKTVWPRTFDRELRAAGLRKERSFSLGFGPFTLFGRPTIRGRAAVALHSRLQQLADERLPLLRSSGAQYMVVARKTG
jgi:ubiquinone/menaquinone biosynthesis C-methylase UbiE